MAFVRVAWLERLTFWRNPTRNEVVDTTDLQTLQSFQAIEAAFSPLCNPASES